MLVAISRTISVLSWRGDGRHLGALWYLVLNIIHVFIVLVFQCVHRGHGYPGVSSMVWHQGWCWRRLYVHGEQLRHEWGGIFGAMWHHGRCWRSGATIFEVKVLGTYVAAVAFSSSGLAVLHQRGNFFSAMWHHGRCRRFRGCGLRACGGWGPFVKIGGLISFEGPVFVLCFLNEAETFGKVRVCSVFAVWFISRPCIPACTCPSSSRCGSSAEPL